MPITSLQRVPFKATPCAWIAIGEIAISPFLAFGGLAVAPIAVGAITVGATVSDTRTHRVA